MAYRPGGMAKENLPEFENESLIRDIAASQNKFALDLYNVSK